MPLNADGSATCDRCGTLTPGYGVLYGLVTTDLDSVGSTVRRLFCYYHDCRNTALGDLLLVPVLPVESEMCAACHIPVRGLAEGMLCSDSNLDGTSRTFLLCYANGHRNALLDNAYGYEPPLITVRVLATTWWNMPEILRTVAADASSNWDVFTTNTVTTVARAVSTTWNALVLSTITAHTATQNAAINSNTVTLQMPPETKVGDLLIATFSAGIGGTPTASDDTWMAEASSLQVGAYHYLYWKFYTAADVPATGWTWRLSGSTDWGGNMNAYTGVNGEADLYPFDGPVTVLQYTSSTTTFTANPITTVYNNNMLFSALAANSGPSPSVTVPAGWTNDTNVNQGFTNGRATAQAHFANAPAGTYSPTWFLSTARAGSVMFAALRPLAAPVLLTVTSSRGSTWNINSSLLPRTATRGATWAARTAVSSSRLTTWSDFATAAAGITARTSTNQSVPGGSASPDTAVVVAKPTDAVTGDVMIVTFTAGVLMATGSTAVPTGWTLLTSATQSGTNVYGYWKRLDASDASTTSYTWTLTSASIWGANAQAFGGVHATTPIDAAAVSALYTATGTTSYAVSYSTVTNGAMLVTSLGANTGGSSITPVPPDGFTADTHVNTGFTSTKANSLAHYLKPTAGSGTYTWTTNSGRAGGVLIVALRPA